MNWLCKSVLTLSIGMSVGAVHSSATAAQSDLQNLERILRDGGYSLLYPLRDNWGPGFVFGGQLSSGKIRVLDRQVCTGVFGNLAPRSTGVVLPNVDISRDVDFRVSIDLLKRIIGDGNSAALKLADFKDSSQVMIRWSNLREWSYFQEDSFLADGSIRPVSANCKAALTDRRTRGLMRNTYVIDRVLGADSIEYEFKRGAPGQPGQQGTISADLKLGDIINVSVGGGWKIEGDTKIVTTQPMYIGYAPPAQIESWLPQGTVSDQVKARLVRLPPNTVVDLSN